MRDMQNVGFDGGRVLGVITRVETLLRKVCELITTIHGRTVVQ